jgi:hypothetical protein
MRVELQILPSRLLRLVQLLSATMVSLALSYLLHALSPGIKLSVLLVMALISTALLSLPIWAKHASTQTINCAILDADRGLWLGRENSRTQLPDGTFPSLVAMRGYLGLTWLRNSSGQEVLLWPDSLSTEQHRQLRRYLA